MNRIRLLAEQVANQIAAGEVIERPASVVKELVENALDAHATRIAVEILGGGRQLVRVTDDGIGMSRDDALLCLERHATSKIRTAEDLTSIATLGFRGEALPSIASVSRFVLTTRERDGQSAEGSQVVVHGGRILEVRSAGAAPGTSVEVRQLFYNLPARRKFLRTEETERAHILHYLTLAALAHPYVAFTLLQESRLSWQLPPLPTTQERLDAVRERFRTLLGGDVSLVRVDRTITAPDRGDEEDPDNTSSIRIGGWIGGPGVSRSTREDQHLFVNQRPVEHRGLNHALLEGYHTSLMKGRFPVCCLFLELPPSDVDVNVHPAKKEVRFRNERAARAAMVEAVRTALLSLQNPLRSRDLASAPSPSPTASSPAPTPSPAEPPPELILLPRIPRVEILRPGTASEPTSLLPSSSERPPLARPLAPPETTPTAPAPAPRGLLDVPLRYLGIVGRLYVLFESDRGLVLMDQHAAHERVLYEQMLQRLDQGHAPSQRLLLPETVELPVRDVPFLREHLDVLGRLGVGLSEFGDRTFLLDALPPFVKASNPRQFVLDVLDELRAAGREVNSLRLGEHMVAKTVCRHAIKANDPLQVPEVEKLLHDLRTCAMPYTCPHGRPTLLELSYSELDRKFGRTE